MIHIFSGFIRFVDKKYLCPFAEHSPVDGPQMLLTFQLKAIQLVQVLCQSTGWMELEHLLR